MDLWEARTGTGVHISAERNVRERRHMFVGCSNRGNRNFFQVPTHSRRQMVGVGVHYSFVRPHNPVSFYLLTLLNPRSEFQPCSTKQPMRWLVGWSVTFTCKTRNCSIFCRAGRCMSVSFNYMRGLNHRAVYSSRCTTGELFKSPYKDCLSGVLVIMRVFYRKKEE